jgi:hypothetical protein
MRPREQQILLGSQFRRLWAICGTATATAPLSTGEAAGQEPYPGDVLDGLTKK